MSPSRFQLGAVLGINQTLSWGMTFYLPAIIADPVMTAFGRSGFAVLGAFSWALLVAGAGAPRIGKWIDRHGGRGALIASIVVIALGQTVLALGHGLAVWYFGWTIIGVGIPLVLYDSAFATVAGLLGEEAEPSITGLRWWQGSRAVCSGRSGRHWLGLGLAGPLLAYAGLMLMVNLPMIWLLVPPAPPRPSRDAGGEGCRSHPPNGLRWCCWGFSSDCAGSSPRPYRCTYFRCCKASG